jgi:hypothetical protein
MTAVWILSFAVFAAYLTAVAALFGVPASVSDSFYLLNGRKPGTGYVFTGWCWLVAFSVTAMMAQLSEGRWWQFLSLFAGGGLCFVGAAPVFRSHERTVHYVSAGVCAAAALAWMTLAGFWWMPVKYLIVALIYGVITKKYVFCIETALFLSMYSVLFLMMFL